MTEPDYYRILQIDPDAEPEVIAAAYRSLARRYHPDVNPSVRATARMAEINAAYAVLSDPVKRAEYDASRATVFDEADSQENVGEEAWAEVTTEYVSEPPPIRKTRRFWTSPVGAAVRWIGVVPGGLALGFLIMFPVHWLIILTLSGCNFDESSLSLKCFLGPERIERWAQGFVTPFSLIYFGSRIAPSRKLETAFVLLLFGTISLTALHVWLHTSGQIYYRGWDWLEYVVLIALSLGGTVAAFLVVRNNQSNR